MPNAIPSRSFPSAMEEGALTLKLPRAPNHCRWMRFLLPITPISRARRMVACVAGDRRWKRPVSLSRRARGGEVDEPDRWGPLVGAPTQATSGATRPIRFSLVEAYFR